MSHPSETGLIYCASCGGICPHREADAQEAWKAAHTLVPGHLRLRSRPAQFAPQPWSWARCACAEPHFVDEPAAPRAAAPAPRTPRTRKPVEQRR